MKKQVQQTGVRKWFGDDWISMQDELFSVLEGFFGNYGQQFILSGCTVNGNDISAGIVGLIDGTGFHLCSFSGVQGTAWPVYFYPSKITESRAYLDNQIKPVSENWTVAISSNNPGGYFQLKQDGTSARFFDAIQTANRRFVTDAEKTNYLAQALSAINTIRGGVAADYDTLSKIATLLLLKANTNSPSLTGTPTAPTAPAETNTTQIATTAFVKAVVAALVASSPTALDTLNELATALGNDPNFATTITNALGGKLNRNFDNILDAAAARAALGLSNLLSADSPQFTGTPTAPTAAPGTNTQQLANTAFVQAALAALVASSPAALDTLNELAAALGNDANFAATMTNALAGKVANNDARLSDQRTPTDLSVAYGKVANGLKTKATVGSAIDLSANGIGTITLTANTAFSFSGFESNKTYLLIVTANGFTPSFAVSSNHVLVEGNAVFGTTGVFYISLTCIDATAGSEKLVTMIMKGA
jgi:hypothetical protein